MAVILVADVGGTNARFQLYSCSQQTSNLISARSFKCNDYYSFYSILEELQLPEHKPTIAVLSVAGVVYNNTVDLTNNHWDPINSDQISAKFEIPKVIFLNDFEGAAYGCLDLDPNLLIQLNPTVVAQNTNSKFVLGPGTGFGEAFLTYHNSEITCWPGEGGACDLCPHDQEEWELCQYILKLISTKEEYVQFCPCESANFEVCLGGMGAFHYYTFFKEKYPELIDQSFDLEWENSNEKMKMMMENGLSRIDKLCEKSVTTWMKFLAYECGNIIAKYLPYGGLYIVGGITAKNFDKIVEWKDEFLRFLETKPKHVVEVIRKVPVFIVKDDDLGMKGALWFAKRILNSN